MAFSATAPVGSLVVVYPSSGAVRLVSPSGTILSAESLPSWPAFGGTSTDGAIGQLSSNGHIFVTAGDAGSGAILLIIDKRGSLVSATSSVYSDPFGDTDGTKIYAYTSTTVVTRYTSAGAVDSTQSVTAAHRLQAGISQDGASTIFSGQYSGAYNTVYKRVWGGAESTLYSLPDVTDDLRVAPTSILPMSDGSTVIAYYDIVDTGDTIVKCIESGGSVRWSTTVALDASHSDLVSMARGGDGTYVWVATYVNGDYPTGSSTSPLNVVKFRTLSMSTGAITEKFEKQWSAAGFGTNSWNNSMMAEVIVSVGPAFLEVVDPSTPCCADGGGGSSAGPIMPPIDPAWTESCTGAGAVATASDITTAEDWSA